MEPESAAVGEPPRRSVWRRRLLLLGLPPLLVLLLGALGGMGFAAVIHMPRVDSLEDFQPGLITELHNRDGEVFASYARERRVLLEEGELPEILVQAILAAEDANFLRHGGVDLEGVVRAVIQNQRRGRRAMGGSTITMQLARRLFLTPKKSWRRKIEEAFLSVELEKTFSKQQILTLYCNMIFLGHHNYGMEMAARDYFGKGVGDLTLTEAATLAGIPQRPSSYSPYRRPDLVVARRNYVLRRMKEEGFIDEIRYQEAIAEPLVVRQQKREEPLAPYFAEEVRQAVERRYGTAALLDRGLQVETTLDPVIQRAAREALRDGLLRLDHQRGWRGPISRLEGEDAASYRLPSWERLDLSPGAWNQGIVLESGHRGARVRIGDEVLDLTPDGVAWTGRRRPSSVLSPGDVAWFRVEEPEEEAADDGDTPRRVLLEQEPELEGAAIVLESSTGAVRALVGGWSFERSKFNRATQARRQLGSAFKPFVWGAALEVGFTPADTLFDAPVAFPGGRDRPPYSPRNHSREYFGVTTLRRGLERSINVTAVKLLDLVGVDRVIDFANRLGITSPLPPVLSMALGSADVIPMEVAAAYAAVANQGVWVEPYFIESVSEPSGRQLERAQPRALRSISPQIAYVLTHLLEGVVDRGTAASINHLEIDLAGKTGTTDQYSDAWFVGFTPRYTLLVWVGHDVKRTIGRQMTGTRVALPIWRDLVEDGLENGWLTPGESFTPPPGVVFEQVELESGLLPGPGATVVIEEAFLAGTQPVQRYTPQWGAVLRLPWYQQQPHYLAKAGERMPEDVEDWEAVLQAWEEKDSPDDDAGDG